MGIIRRPGPEWNNTYIRPWLDNDGTFLIGKYKGESLDVVANDDPSYLQWIVDRADRVSDEDREAIDAALQFRNYRR